MVYVFAEKAVLWISALQISGKNRDRFESPPGVWTNPVYRKIEGIPADFPIWICCPSDTQRIIISENDVILIKFNWHLSSGGRFGQKYLLENRNLVISTIW